MARARAPFIKVCGIQNVDEALGVVAAGATTIGVLVGMTHLAEDSVTVETARRIVDAVAGRARTVMVTHLRDVDKIARLAKLARVDAIQIQDDVHLGEMRRLRTLVPGKTLIKAIHVTGSEAVGQAQHYAPFADKLLLDSRTPERLGGTGQIHDWQLSRVIARVIDIPVILAGGLAPDNVRDAIEVVRPAGIDANSGLERADGSKDLDKVRAFAAAGRYLTADIAKA